MISFLRGELWVFRELSMTWLGQLCERFVVSSVIGWFGMKSVATCLFRYVVEDFLATGENRGCDFVSSW